MSAVEHVLDALPHVAVFHLGAYAVSANPKELLAFKLSLDASLGARDARLAMQSKPSAYTAAVDGFVRLGMSRDDAYNMCVVFEYFSWVPPVLDAVRIWTHADRKLEELLNVARELEGATASGATQGQRLASFERARAIDGELTALETAFGAKLHTISRYASTAIATATISSVVLVSVIVYVLLLRPLVAAANSENRAKENEQRFKDFTEVASDWFLELDSNLTVTSVRGRCSDETKIAEKLFLRREWGEIVAEDKVDIEPHDHLAYLHSRQEFREHVISRKQRDCPEKAWSISGRPYVDARGGYAGYRITCKDNSELVNSNIQLLQARDAAEQASLAKSAFLANMSHELRTPLNAIIGFSDIIATQAMGPIGTERYAEYASDIRTSGHHLLSIISDILDLAKIESGKFEISKDAVEASELVNACISICSSRAALQNVQLEKTIQTSLPTLFVDALRIKQSLINLLSNAIKFSPIGGHVQVSVRSDDRNIYFEVVDHGEGMSKAQLDVALQPFGQASCDAHKRREGTGLGLTITRNLVELHGGELQITSTPGEGTVARIKLPSPRAEAHATASKGPTQSRQYEFSSV